MATIKEQLEALPPRTVEGDQGRWTSHSIHEAIAADRYDASKSKMNSCTNIRRVLKTISCFRLMTHDGPGR